MSQDKPLLGIMLMLGFCIVAPLADAVAKILGPHVPLAELVFVRFAIQAAVLIPLMVLTGRAWRFRRKVMAITFLRTLLHILGIGMMVSALRYLPLADAVAIAFIMPFLMLLLGHFALGEEVGWRRLAACAVGFVGTLMVVQPAFRDVGWPALLPLGVAVNFSVFMLTTRIISREIDAISLQAISGIMAVVVIGLLLLVIPEGRVPDIAWRSVGLDLWGLLLAIGLLGTLGHLLMTWSLRYAPGATLAPMQYLEIPFATIFGFLIFGDLPNPLATLGISITMAAGLYIFMRERATLRAQKEAPAPVPEVVPPAE
ncbi:MAG: EamA family transporter [Rhodobacteraceae bacterium]|jgi:drug/metabolite transporter (DMT)-like permease|uniref:Putative permease, DMT superfamily n=1 Tax=Salipiger profundus TaxID=1229727 RepID=A0A1U7D6I3_9RHOB|nr:MULTISPECIES: DMT family transporter [Salipiger]APX23733.1 putative permease, DMT superfamily [Salipiger profundus]MAB07109.1 EamA family transporter [Paracoccaceae bacterium]GGA17566.1 membrane protein [Salipiger profundus]SFD30488.1 Threonine/homoserine efflux transporter RhtA [Salipiger profundus]